MARKSTKSRGRDEHPEQFGPLVPSTDRSPTTRNVVSKLKPHILAILERTRKARAELDKKTGATPRRAGNAGQ